jgi:hypothetical protein
MQQSSGHSLASSQIWKHEKGPVSVAQVVPSQQGDATLGPHSASSSTQLQ